MSTEIEQIQIALARQSMLGFVYATMPDYCMGWVHMRICTEMDAFLAAVVAGESPRLMLTMPPRHGKSELASRRFPAYVFGRYPDISIIGTSYSADLSSRMSRDIQRIIEQPEYEKIFPGTTIPKQRKRTVEHGNWFRNSELFEIVGHRGSYRSAGVGGGITGMGGDILIVDDPFKDRAEADSETIRRKVWDWYTSTLYTRLAPGGGIIIINTRWHMDDLSGRLLEAEKTGEGDKWRVVNFPAIAEHDEPYRKEGEPLHPARYPLEQLLSIKKAIGSRDWEALYQQHPTPDGGSIFRSEWFKFYFPKDLPKSYSKIVISWDMTFKDSASSDFVVGQVWGKDGANFYLLDMVRGRWDFVETLKQFKALKEKHPKASRILVEDKANGPAVISTFRKTIPGIIAVEPDGSKTARAHAVTSLFEAGNIYIPDVSLYPWVRPFIDELIQFPSGSHDDQVDAATQAIRDLTTTPALNISPAVMRPMRFR